MINEKLTILIILYEENLDIIKKCLDQIKEFKIIIIDNANDENLKKKIGSNYKIYKYFLNKKNIGFSKAANQGIKECDTEYLLILGADCLITQKDINQLMLAKQKYQDCFLTSPTFYDLKVIIRIMVDHYMKMHKKMKHFKITEMYALMQF